MPQGHTRHRPTEQGHRGEARVSRDEETRGRYRRVAHGPLSPGQPARKGPEPQPRPRRHGWEVRGGSSAPRAGRGREVAECAGS